MTNDTTHIDWKPFKEKAARRHAFWNSLKEGDLLSIEESNEMEAGFTLLPQNASDIRGHSYYFESQVSSFGKYFNKPHFIQTKHVFVVLDTIQSPYRIIRIVNLSNLHEYPIFPATDLFNEIDIFRVFVNGKEFSWAE